MTTVVSDRERWWSAIGYKVKMLRALATDMTGVSINCLPDDVQRVIWLIPNLITEGKVLHTRNLCNFCLSEDDHSIRLSTLFDNYHEGVKYAKLRDLIDLLSEKYRKKLQKNCPRWAFHARLAHPNRGRGLSF